MRRVFLLICIAGCGDLHTARDAPFPLRGGRALWAVYGQDAVQGQGVVLIPEGDLTCEDLDGDLLEILAGGLEGRGLALYAQYLAPAEAELGWPGLYTDGDPVRTVTALTWHDGFTHVSESESAETWLRLDEVGPDVAGSFHTQWWWGDLKAVRCE